MIRTKYVPESRWTRFKRWWDWELAIGCFCFGVATLMLIGLLVVILCEEVGGLE
jgi:hypothetical protein